MALDNDITINIGAFTKEFEKALRRVKRKGDETGDKLEKKPRRFGGKNLRPSILSIVSALAAVGYGVKQAIGEFQQFKLGLAGVQKVADLSQTELKKFENNIDALSKKIPVSTAELFEAAEAAAVLGIRGADNLTKFSETMGRLGVATDVNGEEAAKAISRIIQLSGESIDTIDQFGSALVGLGNNFKASESEILANATTISQATAQYNISSHEILAFAAATKEAGIASDLAGTSMGMTLREMDKALVKGGKSLKSFETVMGMTREEIQKLIKDKPAQAFQVFINGLSRMNKSGQNTILMMESMGLGGRQLMKTLPSLAKINDRMNLSLEESARFHKENNAMMKESNQFFEESIKKQETAFNKIKSLSKTIGSILTPAWDASIKVIGELADDTNMVLGGAVSSVEEKIKAVEERLSKSYGSSKTRLEQRLKLLKEELAITKQITERSKGVTKQDAFEDKRAFLPGLATGTSERTPSGTSSTVEDPKPLKTPEQLELEEEERQNEILRKEMEIESTEIHLQQLNNLKLDLENKSQKETHDAIEKGLKSKSKLEQFQAKKKMKFLKQKAQEEEQLERTKQQAIQSMTSGAFALLNALHGKQSKALFYLERAMALGQIAFSTQVAVMKAQAATSPIPNPVVPWLYAQGAGAAATVLAQTIVQKRGFQDGGIVSRSAGTPLTGDHQLARLEAGEFVTPKRNAEQEIDKRARERGYQQNDWDMDEDQMENKSNEIVISLQDDASDFIFAERRKNQSLGIGVT